MSATIKDLCIRNTDTNLIYAMRKLMKQNDETEIFMQLIPFVFNAGNVQEGVGVSITRSNVSTYIESIRRKL